jgi:hypoxanthine phosphoribosyltransferase
MEGKKVLLIDDVNDTGKTLHEALKHISSKNPDTIRSAVIHEKQNDLFRADFVGNRLKEWKWLIYQWAATEDVLEFLNKDGMLGSSADEARNHLKKTYDLEIGDDVFQDIMMMKKNYY